VTTWLARRRITLGFFFGALVLWFAQPSLRSLAAGTLIACAGEALRIWAAGHLNKARELTSSGPYRWVSHPLYIGSAIMGAGLAVASGSIIVALLIALYLSLTITAAVKSEEAFLSRAFGDEYDRYRSGVVGTARFTLSRTIENREHRAAIGLALAVLLLFLKATYNGLFWRVGG
jgi:protein-S-isoprenylcysteine O-methyltransferase Ste14